MTEPKQLSEIHAVILKPAERLRIGEDLTNTIQKKRGAGTCTCCKYGGAKASGAEMF